MNIESLPKPARDMLEKSLFNALVANILLSASRQAICMAGRLISQYNRRHGETWLTRQAKSSITRLLEANEIKRAAVLEGPFKMILSLVDCDDIAKTARGLAAIEYGDCPKLMSIVINPIDRTEMSDEDLIETLSDEVYMVLPRNVDTGESTSVLIEALEVIRRREAT